jgi:signal transduction histidine kinase
MSLFKKSALKRVLQKEKEKKKKHTLLLVDDEEYNIIILEGLFGDDYHLLTASDGLEALKIIEDPQYRNKIDLIISDQRMPEMTGVEFLHESISISPQTKRILLTGYTDVNDIIDSINKGQIYKFMLKPFDHRDMKQTVKLALEALELEEQNTGLVQDLQKLNSELEQKVEGRTAELQQALHELSALNANKDRLFSILAHDLKNPLHAFILTAETLVEDIDFFSKEEIGQLAGNMYRGSQNLYRLLENLLFWAREQMEESRFHPASHQLHKVTAQMISIVEDNAKLKGIAIRNLVDPAHHGFVDKSMFEVVIRNLLTNAIKFSFEGGEIDVRSEDLGDEIEVSVCDRGVGILPDGLSKLFRVDQSFTTRGTKDEKGTGLGLILCKELVEKHKGTIAAESEPSHLTRFYFTIPKEQEQLLQEPTND